MAKSRLYVAVLKYWNFVVVTINYNYLTGKNNKISRMTLTLRIVLKNGEQIFRTSTVNINYKIGTKNWKMNNF